MSDVTHVAFRSSKDFGHVSTYTESDGSMWARISLNGVVLSYEQISDPVPLEPMTEPFPVKIPGKW